MTIVRNIEIPDSPNCPDGKRIVFAAALLYNYLADVGLKLFVRNTHLGISSLKAYVHDHCA